ncbi:MAG: DUF2235 domain-containing protein [Victivallales bacterium]
MKNTFSVFFDGTGNGPQDKYPSNVFKLYKLFDAMEDKKSFLPRAFYSPGPGAREYDVIAGNVAGSGIWDNVKDAYRESAKVFNPDIDIAIFGFSRGAYTAHLFAWLLQCCGIPADLSNCDEIVDRFKENPVDTLKNYREERTTVNAIRFLGVWDIVKSIRPDKNYYDGRLPDIVQNAYHAMALDEVRKDFPVMKWASSPVLQQTWFAGVHSDVGGGYETCGLSDITFKWMYEHIKENELPCSSVADDFFHMDYKQDLNDPFKDAPKWWIRGKKARTFVRSENVDISVYLRHEVRKDYTPQAHGWQWS